jgi:hypothetical protein
MYFYLKIVTLILVLWPVSSTVFGASPIENKPNLPYEVLTMDSQIETRQVYLGKLTGDPHTYEFSIGAERELVVNLSQERSEEIIPLSIIVVKVNDNNRGVQEMGRLSSADNSWSKYRDSAFGLSLYSGKTFKLSLTPGIYRLEISAPENLGKYLMVVGKDNSQDGYFASLGHIRVVQKFFDLSIFSMLRSSYVYYPLGIIILAGLFYLTWRNRDRLREVRSK